MIVSCFIPFLSAINNVFVSLSSTSLSLCHHYFDWLIQCSIFITFFITVMVIGFTQRMRTVSESDAPEEEDFSTIDIDVATQRPAEREHPMVFRVQESSSTAIVEPKDDLTNPLFDARFGRRSGHGDPIEEEFVPEYLQYTLPSLTAVIKDDSRPEDDECFTIRIFPGDVPGRKETFNCYENDNRYSATNYFCETTICIEDNDGQFFSCVGLKINP